jgi:ribosomal-protein-alanine N-acetyltransferase
MERICHRTPWRRDAFSPDSQESGFRSLVLVEPALEGDILVGYICFMTLYGEMEIHNVTVRPDARRRGAGARLLDAALEEGARLDCRIAWLEVRASNAAAKRLYASRGFQVAATRRGYYADGEDALVMRAGLSPRRSGDGSG